jgi:hypothetical protein
VTSELRGSTSRQSTLARFSMASSCRETLVHIRQLPDEVVRVGALWDTRLNYGFFPLVNAP